MRMQACGALLLLGALSACGSDAPAGLRVTCVRGGAVQPVDRVDVRTQPPSNQAPAAATLTFRDPLNKNQTGTMRIEPGDSCSIGLATKV